MTWPGKSESEWLTELNGTELCYESDTELTERAAPDGSLFL